jgi:hypothetical protein
MRGGSRIEILGFLSHIESLIPPSRDLNFIVKLAKHIAKNSNVVGHLFSHFLIEGKFYLIERCDEAEVGSAKLCVQTGVRILFATHFDRDEHHLLADSEIPSLLKNFSLVDVRRKRLQIQMLREASLVRSMQYIRGQSAVYQVEERYIRNDYLGYKARYCNPSVGLICSIYKAKKYLPGFISNLKDSVSLQDTEVLFFDVNQDREDYRYLTESLCEFSNFRYFKLHRDPGLYDIWNLGIHLTRAPIVGNANVDDRRHPLQIKTLLDKLNWDKKLTLCSTVVVPFQDLNMGFTTVDRSFNDEFFNDVPKYYGLNDMFILDGAGKTSSQCIPHCMPLWRKSAHREAGYFNERTFKSAADFELWLRLLALGHRFMLCHRPFSFYYVNPASYMRSDSSHSIIPETLYEVYGPARKVRQTPPYHPDFQELESLIEYSIGV